MGRFLFPVPEAFPGGAVWVFSVLTVVFVSVYGGWGALCARCGGRVLRPAVSVALWCFRPPACPGVVVAGSF